MREIAHIRATMLGRFALQQTGMKEPRMVSLAGRSGRLWTLVAYLILHRDRGIPAQELIDLLWPDGSGSNPASTLQNNASRARHQGHDSLRKRPVPLGSRDRYMAGRGCL